MKGNAQTCRERMPMLALAELSRPKGAYSHVFHGRKVASMEAETKEKKPRKAMRVPHVYVIIFALMAVMALLTWIIPSGAYQTKEVNGREVTVAGTYKEVSKVSEADGQTTDLRQGIPQLFEAPLLGIESAVEVVGFILIVGGSFQIITKTGAITAGMGSVIKRFKDKDILIIPIVMILFSLGGSTFGMAEETLPFFAIFMPIMMSMGFDSMTAFMVVFMSARIGYVGSTVNPFSVLIAQGIIGLQGNPQLWLRTIEWVILTAITVVWVVRYARRVRANPESSITYHDDIAKRKEFQAADGALDVSFTGRQRVVLGIFAAAIVIIVWGLVTQGWYMVELSAVFLAAGILSGVVDGMSSREIAEEFVKGLADFAFSAIVVGLAKGILVIANNGMIIDTILNFLANGMAGVPAGIYTTLMFLVEGLLTILVPSSSGLAALTMPIFGPLTELMGLNPEAAVTALSLAEPLMCIVCPTSAILVAGLGVCKIDLGQWWKTCWKFMLLITVLCITFTAISGVIPA